MGYQKADGRWAGTIAVALVGEAAYAESFYGEALEVGDKGTAVLELTVVADEDQSVTDLDVEIETSEDASTWRSLGSFTTATGAGTERIAFPGVDRWLRAFAVIDSDVPPDWEIDTAYSEDDLVMNGGNAYKCVTAGTSFNGPVGTGSDIADGTVVWDYILPTAWLPATAYIAGQYVTNDTGKLYRLVTPGSSVAGPTGTGTAIVDGGVEWDYIATPAWTALHLYTSGDYVTNDTGKLYLCITTGTSAGSGGPTGTSADITDGTAHWKHTAKPAWLPATAKIVGDVVLSDTDRFYVATDAGTTAAGPTGTAGGDIEDGSAEWNYVPVTAWDLDVDTAEGDVVTNDTGKHYVATDAGTTEDGPSGTGSAIDDGSAAWDFVTLAVTFSVTGELK